MMMIAADTMIDAMNTTDSAEENVAMMNTQNAPARPAVAQTAANLAKRELAERALCESLNSAQVRGFFGMVAVEVSVQDGTIQHIRRRVEQLEK